MKGNRKIREFKKALKEDYGSDYFRIMDSFWPKYEKLLSENPDESPELKEHTVGVIYPTIAMCEALMENGKSREEAVSWLYKVFENEAEKDASSMRLMLKIPFVYKLVPKMFISTQEKSFGEKAGFKSEIIVNEKGHTHFDMLKCPYNEIFRKYGYTDLIDCLCHQDDVKNGSMHPKLKWHREHTLSSGSDRCDFDIEIMKKK